MSAGATEHKVDPIADGEKLPDRLQHMLQAQHPQPSNPPASVRTLLSRKSWFLDADAARGVLGRSVSNAALGETVSRGGSLRGDSPRSHRGTSSDVESPAAAGGPSRRKGPQAGGGGSAAGGVRWSDSSSAADEGLGDGGEASGAQPGASPTPELLLERRVLARRSPAHLQTVGEASESGSPLSGAALRARTRCLACHCTLH